MRSIQEIFNAVIQAGQYGRLDYVEFMCHSLRDSARVGVISAEEKEFAEAEIAEYLKDLSKVRSGRVCTTLASALSSAGVPRAHDPKYRLELYRNWAKRPHAPTRSVQAVFCAVIKAGYYDIDRLGMCFALLAAKHAGVITDTEYKQNRKVIQKYLEELRGSQGTYLFLWNALKVHGLPYKFEDRKALYLNWAERPRLKGNRTVQQIFNAVIDAEYYCVVGDYSTGCAAYMCNSLLSAYLNNCITGREYDKAHSAVIKYIGASNAGRALRSCLDSVGLSCEHSDCVAIYRNWKARPKLKPKS